jgi:uncharacterized tellurite resistance protein B-like protein
MELPIETEQEAAVALLFAGVMHGNKTLNQSQIEQLSRMLVLSTKFKGSDLNELSKKGLSVQAQHGSKTVIEQCAPKVSDDFKETLFAMTCELVTANGKIDESESEILAMTALYLGLEVERMRMILTSFLIRNRWNVQIIDPELLG